MGANTVLTGGEVLLDGSLRRADVPMVDGLIADARPSGAETVDMSGLWLLPGVVDVHGDAIERIVMPRAGVAFPLPLALLEADRQLLANGVTTAFHGLTISWEPGLRSLDAARAFLGALEAARPGLGCDTRINFRWETLALDEMDEVIDWLGRSPGAILSLNDHTTAHLGLPATSRKIVRMAERTGLAPEECLARLAEAARRTDEQPAAVARMAAAGQAAGLALFAHDEGDAPTRAAHRALGVTVCEFPLNRDTARAARAAGEAVVLGAPNVLRGGSHNGALDAGPAIAEGLGTVLASDYYYPSQVQAAFVLAQSHGLAFGAAWACVSANAAAAAGLTDRGRIAAGLRADVVAVCPATRRVRAVYVAGERKLSLA